jgi:hypothetical protein
MPVTMQHDRDNIFRVELRGTLGKTELERCQTLLKTEMDRVGPVKLLFVLAEFDGWEPGANGNDLSFYVGHGDRIDRIAIVGPERWRSETLMFAGADLRRAPVEFFTEDAVTEARTWLAS